MTVLEATAATFAKTLPLAKSGDRIALEPGRYPPLAFKALAFDPPVTVTSADPARPAVLTEMKLDRCSGLVFTGLEFDCSESKKSLGAFEVFDCKSITFTGLNVHGTLDGDPTEDVAGLRINRGFGITVSDSELQQLHIAIGHRDVDGLTVTGNYIHDCRLDGVRGGGSSNVEVSGNFITDFYRVPGDHADGIQFYTSGSPVSVRNINIHGNAIVQGRGEVMQGIFLRAQPGLQYIDVTIGGNLIVRGNHNAICVDGGRNIKLIDNTVVSDPDHKTWITVKNAEAVESRGNQAAIIGMTEAVTGLKGAGDRLVPTPEDGGVATMKAWVSARPAMMARFPALCAAAGIEPPPPKPAPAYPSRRAAFEAWDQKLAEMGGILAFLRAGEA